MARCYLISDFDVIVIGGGPSGSATALGCASAGMSVMVVEKGDELRDKPCGGVLPWVASDTVEGIIGKEIPSSVMADPNELGLYYVPPSGRRNGGRVAGYKIHNIDRILFDKWLRDEAGSVGAEFRYNTKFVEFEGTDPIKVKVEQDGEARTITSRFLVGADGVRSDVRAQLLPGQPAPVLLVAQELWEASGDFEDCFYGFFSSRVSSSYAYLIPKGQQLLVGLGVQPKQDPDLTSAMSTFKEWLAAEFALRTSEMVKREVWAIPYGFFHPGLGNVLLVGDAAGLCNPLSGEGIRLGIESGDAASTAISSEAESSSLIGAYVKDVGGIAEFVGSVYDFVQNLDDQGREKFVSDELNRRSQF
ncbi:MAG: NAD(P)/FAD-dependent oxidoreductase [Candidatus Thorarchaeota archaeon]|nr:MAG: NAD(P)/FAD-dependent oxidoreductase [Candidatus Thorarchaeota archaeon]